MVSTRSSTKKSGGTASGQNSVRADHEPLLTSAATPVRTTSASTQGVTPVATSRKKSRTSTKRKQTNLEHIEEPEQQGNVPLGLLGVIVAEEPEEGPLKTLDTQEPACNAAVDPVSKPAVVCDTALVGYPEVEDTTQFCADEDELASTEEIEGEDEEWNGATCRSDKSDCDPRAREESEDYELDLEDLDRDDLVLESLGRSIRQALSSRGQALTQPPEPHHGPPASSGAAVSVDVDRSAEGTQVPDAPSTSMDEEEFLRLEPSKTESRPVEEEAVDERQLQWRIPQVLPSVKDLKKAELQKVQLVNKEKDLAKKLVVPPRDARLLAKQAAKEVKPTAGKKWYDLPSPVVDEDTKRELRLLRLRGAMDPKRFYKSFDGKALPKFFHMGTIVDDPLDYYSGRLTRSERKSTLTEQLLADQQLTQHRKKKIAQLMEENSRYQKLKKRKTDLPRVKPRKRSKQ